MNSIALTLSVSRFKFNILCEVVLKSKDYSNNCCCYTYLVLFVCILYIPDVCILFIVVNQHCHPMLSEYYIKDLLSDALPDANHLWVPLMTSSRMLQLYCNIHPTCCSSLVYWLIICMFISPLYVSKLYYTFLCVELARSYADNYATVTQFMSHINQPIGPLNCANIPPAASPSSLSGPPAERCLATSPDAGITPSSPLPRYASPLDGGESQLGTSTRVDCRSSMSGGETSLVGATRQNSVYFIVCITGAINLCSWFRCFKLVSLSVVL